MGNTSASIYLETRSKDKNKHGGYYVKIRVTFHLAGKWIRKYYPTGYSCTKSEFRTFSSEQNDVRPEMRSAVREQFNKAAKAIRDGYGKSIESFEGEYFGQARDTVNGMHQVKIAQLKAADRIGSMRSYECSLASLKEYKKHLDKSEIIQFPEITADWLRGYESWMIGQENTINTVGVYLRNLRHIFNMARNKPHRVIPSDVYPFDEYQIRSEKKFKIPLSDKELEKMKEFTSKDSALMEARDFWLFSYYCNGMNFADLAKIRHSDIQEEFLLYNRKKIRGTVKDFRPIVIPIDHEIRAIIKRQGAKTLNPGGYVFPILDEGLGELETKKRVGWFIKRINAGLKEIAGKLSIKKKLTTVIARHSFANRILNATDGDTRMIQEGLGHSSIETSEHYKGSLYLEKIKKARRAL